MGNTPENVTAGIAEEIIKVLDYLGEKFGMVIDYTAENIVPEVTALFDKYIAWQISTSIVWIVAAVLLFLATLIFAIIVNKKCDTDGYEWGILIAVGVLMFIVIFTQTFDIVEAITFPEKSIYDYMKWCNTWK